MNKIQIETSHKEVIFFGTKRLSIWYDFYSINNPNIGGIMCPVALATNTSVLPCTKYTIKGPLKIIELGDGVLA